MDDNELWDHIVAIVREQPPTTRGRDEYWVDAKHDKQKRKSQVQIVANGFMRTTEKGNEQPIPKSEVLRIARSAMDSAIHKFKITGMKTEDGGRYGSIVCAILDKLPEFSYETGQWLVYHSRD